GIMALMVIILGLTLTQLALRFARLAISEMVKLPALKNVYVTSIIVSIITFVLTSSRFGAPWGFIWTLFGGSNQLLAGVTLLRSGIMALMVIILGLTLTQLALRFARLAISEMVKLPALKNVYVTSIIVSIITFVLTSSRFGAPWGFIWTLFGGSNQLLAGVTLL